MLITIEYQPIILKELISLAEILKNMSNNIELEEIISLCSLFLTIQEGTIYFVYQSAKDYLVEHTSTEIFPDRYTEEQQQIVSGLIEAIDKILQRDFYSLQYPGYSINKVEYPDPDLLALIRYTCIYWVDSLCKIKYSYNKVSSIITVQSISF